MIEEKEVSLLAKLYHIKDFSNSFFKKKGGTRSDIEMKINNSIRNNNFDIFWKKLVSLGIIFLLKEVPSRGNKILIYSINKNKLIKYLKLFNHYQEIKKIVWNHDV